MKLLFYGDTIAQTPSIPNKIPKVSEQLLGEIKLLQGANQVRFRDNKYIECTVDYSNWWGVAEVLPDKDSGGAE